MPTAINGTTGVSQVQDGTITTTKIVDSSVIPSKLSGLVVTQANQTPLPAAAALISFTHGLGSVPVSVEIELVCLTAQNGYAIGDVVTISGVGSGSSIVMPTIRKGTTAVDARVGDTAGFYLLNGTTGGYFNPTAANWAWRFKVRAA